MEPAPRTLIGTVGYHNLGNHSIGPLLLPRLQRLSWPEGVCVEELNWGPVAIVQRLQSEDPPFDRIVLVCARESRLPEGTITVYRWQGGLPPAGAIQARIAEAVTGVISADNLLVVGEYFGVWPDGLYLIDIAPGPERNGARLTAPVAAQTSGIVETIRRLALDPSPGLNCRPLDGRQLEEAPPSTL